MLAVIRIDPSTSCNGSNEGLQDRGPRVVPGSNYQHNTQRFRLYVNIISCAVEILLHMLRSCPVYQVTLCQLDVTLNADQLKE